jgi:CheY-like chemotaxis protein
MAGEASERRLLVVEDNPFNRRVVGLMLGRLGHAHDFAASGVEALAAATARSYALVFMDFELPDIRGDEVTRKIRAGEGPNRDAPIVGLTAAAAAEVQECLASGMNAVVTKPVTVEHIIDTLAQFLAPA